MPDLLKQYYSYVNQAEMQVVESDYVLASLLYDSAFNYLTQPFGRDLYNRAVCASLLRDYKTADTLLTFLVAKAYPIDSLTIRAVFQEFFESDRGKQLIRFADTNPEHYDVKLRHLVDSILVVDQHFRKMEGGYDVYGDTIKKIDRSNVDLIEQLIAKHGFPSQALIGVYPDFDYWSIRIMIIHNQVGGWGEENQYLNFTDILYQAIYKGALDVRLASQLVAGSLGNDIYGDWLTGIERHGLELENQDAIDSTLSDWGFIKPSDQMERDIDSIRAGIGLCSLQDTRTKTVYGMHDNRFKMTDPTGRRILLWSNKNQYEEAVSNMIPTE